MSQSQEFDPTATCVFGISPADESGDTIMPLPAYDRGAIGALPAGSAPLIMRRGPNTGACFLLGAETTSTNRSPKPDIFPDDVTVPRPYYQSTAVDRGHAMHGSGSLNNTYVSRERVDSACLNIGDEIQIGKHRLIYQPSSRTA